MKKLLWFVLWSGLATLTGGAADLSPTRWEKDIARFEAADRTNPPPQGAVLFVGSSNVRMWNTLEKDFAGLQVINRGFGGCYLSDVAHFANRIIIPYKPRLIVVSAGSNDINGKRTPEEVAASFRELVANVRAKLPDARIYYVSMSASKKRWEQQDRQKEANALIKAAVEAGTNLEYIDTCPMFLGPDGQPIDELFLADRLHPSDRANALRAALIKPRLEAALAAKP